jgi:hypothetical protein
VWLYNQLRLMLMPIVNWPLCYRADAETIRIGFGKGLYAYLERISIQDIRDTEGFLSMLAYTTPPVAQRKSKLEQKNSLV